MFNRCKSIDIDSEKLKIKSSCISYKKMKIELSKHAQKFEDETLELLENIKS